MNHLLHHKPCLDGVRGFAIVLVLLSHSAFRFFQGGFIGVDLFFVLSGFLITSWMIRDQESSNGFSFRSFYARRFLRLFPALIFFFTFVWFVLLFLNISIQTHVSDLALSTVLTFVPCANWLIIYHKDWPPFLIHLWSLSIEEQFYLIWPWMLLFILHKKRKLQNRILWIGIILILLWIWRIALWNFSHHAIPRNYFGTDTRISPILLGCLGALLVYKEKGLRLLQRHAQKLIYICTFVLATALIFFRTNGSLYYYGGIELCGLASLGLILAVFVSQHRSIFDSWIFRNLGLISYSLYLWNGIFSVGLVRFHSLYQNPLAYFCVTLVCSLAVSLLSYHLVEKQFLKLKTRVSFSGSKAAFVN